MHRSSYYETQDPSSFNKNNIGNLIYRYETRKGAQLQEILNSPHLQRDLDMFYGQSRSDFHGAVARMRLQQHNESLTSLTDSEYFNDDQTGFLMKEKVADNLTRLGRFLDFLSRLPLPLSFTGMGICFLFAVFICPRTCCENILFPAFRLAFGTLYPAYASYKAVRTKNVKEYVKWMMYWIVYAFFTCIETFTDIFLSWFPFYYEFKVIMVLWLLSPATKGSSTLYRKFVHPMLTRREQEIDEYLNQAKERGYTAVLQLGSKGVNYATNVIMQTALKGGGNLVQTLRRSYSLSDLSEPDVHRTQDEMVPLTSSAYGFLPHVTDESQIDEVVRPQRLRPRSQTVRSSSGGRQTMYFSEVDVEPKIPSANYNYIRSSEDISSGYSSAEPISGGLSRTSSMTNTTRPRFKAKRAEDESSAETDEYESSTKIHTPIHSSPYMTPYKFNPNKEAGRVPYKFLNDLEDWKDDAFFNNQRYYQDHDAERRGSSSGNEFDSTNMTPEMRDKYEMFCRWLENNEVTKKTEEACQVERKEQSPAKSCEDIQSVEQPTCVPLETIADEEFKDTMSTASADEEFVDVITENKENLKINDDSSKYEDAENVGDNLKEQFQLAEETEEEVQSAGKRVDAFAKVVVLDSENSENLNSPPIPSTVPQEAEITSKLEPDVPKETTNITESKETYTLKEKQESDDLDIPNTERKKSLPIESLLENLAKESETTLSVLKTNLQNSGTITSVKLGTEVLKTKPVETELSDSALDLSKRPANHSKGKAPEPPEHFTSPSMPENATPPPPPPPSSRSVRAEIPPSSLQQSSSSLKTPSDPLTSHASHSRSPSPKLEGKSKSKKSLFKNYLPSLFRSEAPKHTPGLLDDYHKETQI